MGVSPQPRQAKLVIDDKTEIPLKTREGSMGELVIETAGLFGSHNILTGDPSLDSTAVAESDITLIDGVGDGKQAILLHRGYPIQELAQKCSFLELAYLLINPDLPTSDQLKEFSDHITRESGVFDSQVRFISGANRAAHPMPLLASAMLHLESNYPPTQLTPETYDANAFRILAQMPITAALIHRHRTSGDMNQVSHDSSLGYSGNFINMMFSGTDLLESMGPLERKILNAIFILHADHEQNASTTMMRGVISTGSSPFAAVAAAITALWGPRHGGANQRVLGVLKDLIDGKTTIEKLIHDATVPPKDQRKNIEGMGHRVYKSMDPRAAIMKVLCDEFFASRQVDDPYLKMAKQLEQAVLSDSTLPGKGVWPNVDFYSGILMHGLGIPNDMFTVLFALGRVAGWLAQGSAVLKERIVRPRQIYNGEPLRPVPDRQMPDVL